MSRDDAMNKLMTFGAISIYWIMFCGLCLATRSGIYYLLDTSHQDWLLNIFIISAFLSIWGMFLYPIVIGCQEIKSWFDDNHQKEK